MTTSYLLRLLCICLASFFLVHLAVGAVISLLSPWLIRRAGNLQPRAAARLLLTARVAPAAVAIFVVVWLCVPSFLWLEQNAEAEEIGWVCLSAAALGLLIATQAIAITVRAVFRSRRYVRAIRATGTAAQYSSGRPGGWIVETAHGSISLAGVWRPRVFVSHAIVELLSREQLAAALRHERAHRDSRDNLKRLMILAAPGLLPFLHGFGELERAWNRFTEWAADDGAVAGSSRRSLALAAALVRVARLGPGAEPQPLVTSFVGGGEDLSARVERLLRETAPIQERANRTPMLRAGIMLLLAGAGLAAAQHSVTLTTVHSLLEDLIR